MSTEPASLEEIQALNRWQRARYGTTSARDRVDHTAIRYRNELAHVAGGHPEGYSIWPRVRADLSDPNEFTWLGATTGWEAWRNGKPDKLLVTVPVPSPGGPMQVLEAAKAACAACLRDAEEGHALREVGPLDLFAVDPPAPVDFTVFTVHDGEIYLDHAQIYAQYEVYRRTQGMPVRRTDSVRREMNRRVKLGSARAFGQKGYRKFHIADVAAYASFGFAGVREVFGKSEEEILAEIRGFQELAETLDSETREVPLHVIREASRFLDMLRTRIQDEDERRRIEAVSDACHELLGTRYRPGPDDSPKD